MNHQSEDTHHSSSAVVELNGALTELGFFIERVPAKVNEAITKVTFS